MFPAHQIPGNEHECDLDEPCPTCGNQPSPQPLISSCGGCSPPQSKEPFGSGHCPRVKVRPPPPKKETPCRRPEPAGAEKKVGPTPEKCTEPCTLDCGGSKKNESCMDRHSKKDEAACGVKKCTNKFMKPDYCGMLKGKPKPPCARTKFSPDAPGKGWKMACGPKGFSCCHNKGDAFKSQQVPILPKEKPIPNPCGNRRVVDPNNPCEMYSDGNPCKRIREEKKCSTSCQERLRKAACAGCDRFNNNNIEEFPTVCPCQQKPKPKRPPCVKKKKGGGEGDVSAYCVTKKIDRCGMIEDPIRKKRCEAYANMKFDKVDPNALGKKKPGRVCPKKDEGSCARKRSDEEANKKTTCPCCDDRHDELNKKKAPASPTTEYMSPCKRRALENPRNAVPACPKGGPNEKPTKFCCGGEGCSGGENAAAGGGAANDGNPCAAMKSKPSPENYIPPPSKEKPSSKRGSGSKKTSGNEGTSCPNASEPPFACSL